MSILHLSSYFYCSVLYSVRIWMLARKSHKTVSNDGAGTRVRGLAAVAEGSTDFRGKSSSHWRLLCTATEHTDRHCYGTVASPCPPPQLMRWTSQQQWRRRDAAATCTRLPSQQTCPGQVARRSPDETTDSLHPTHNLHTGTHRHQLFPKIFVSSVLFLKSS